MKIKKIILEVLYIFLNYKKKRKIFKSTFDCKLLSSKSLIFFANQINKDLRSSTKFFIKKNHQKIRQIRLIFFMLDLMRLRILS